MTGTRGANAPGVGPDAGAEAGRGPGTSSEPEITIAFTPKQLFTGFAIVAGLILFLVRRRGRGRTSAHGRSAGAGRD